VSISPAQQGHAQFARWSGAFARAYRGQDVNALQTIRVILEQMQSECPGVEACQDAASLPYSPFLWPLHQAPNFRGWANEVLETDRLQLRNFLG